MQRYQIDSKSYDIIKSGLLIPAWVFYGDWRVKNAEDSGRRELYDEQTRPYMLIAVNAIDGTIIDPLKGY